MARDGDWDPENPFEDEESRYKSSFYGKVTFGYTGFKHKGLKGKSSKDSPSLYPEAMSMAAKQILPNLLKGKNVQFQDFVQYAYSANIVANLYTWVWILDSVEEKSHSPGFAHATYKPTICYAEVTLDPQAVSALPDPTMLYGILKSRLLDGLYTLEIKVHKLKASLKPITGYEYIPATCDTPFSGAHTLHKMYSVKTPKYGLPNF